ncbi:MAG: glycosyltransferase family 2 protein [Bacteroidota bacterium]
MTENSPLVSVITVCLDSADTVRRAVESVLAQTYPRIEYILVDGGSTDETLSILKEYQSRVKAIVSEPDRGIGDAFNKGIGMSTGEFIQLLNSDDYLPPEKIERSVARLQANPKAGYVFGDIVKIGEDGKQERIEGDPHFPQWIRFTMGRLNHPTILARKSMFDRYGLFDERWHVAMDYDWLLRLYRRGTSGLYSPDVVVYMREGGASDSRAFRAFREVRDISIRHGFSPVGAYVYYWMRCVKHVLYVSLGWR